MSRGCEELWQCAGDLSIGSGVRGGERSIEWSDRR
jgi:hypothetical protein